MVAQTSDRHRILGENETSIFTRAEPPHVSIRCLGEDCVFVNYYAEAQIMAGVSRAGVSVTLGVIVSVSVRGVSVRGGKTYL